MTRRADNTGMRARLPLTGLGCLTLAAGLLAQTPQPFPRQQPRPAAPAPAPPAAPPQTPAPAAQAAAPPSAAPAVTPVPGIDPERPTADQLGIFIPQTAQFVASYDAGRGQRYYIFGTAQPFADVVTAYRTALREKGSVVFEQPPTHTWEIGKFREESMGFPPGVTVKDYTSAGSAGYPNPRRGEQPERFATLIQIVPPPPVDRRR